MIDICRSTKTNIYTKTNVYIKEYHTTKRPRLQYEKCEDHIKIHIPIGDKLETENLGVEVISDDLAYIKNKADEHKNVYRHNYVKLGFLIHTIALNYASMLKNKNN